MPKPQPDPNRSRSISRTQTGIEWASILAILKRGLELDPEGREAELVRKLLPDLERDVAALRRIEIFGCGLDHPDWRESAR